MKNKHKNCMVCGCGLTFPEEIEESVCEECYVNFSNTALDVVDDLEGLTILDENAIPIEENVLPLPPDEYDNLDGNED